MVRTVGEREKLLATDYLGRAEAAFLRQQKFQRVFKRNRKYTFGRVGDDEGNTNDDPVRLVRANLVYSTMHGMVPHMYAQNPRVSVRPAEAVGPHRSLPERDFARTAEITLNRALSEARLKPIMKRLIRGAMTCGWSWMKLVYQRASKVNVPYVMARIQDTQDELRRVQAMMVSLQDPAVRADKELLREQLALQLETLQDSAQVLVAEGIVLEPVQTEDIAIEQSMRFLCDYVHSPMIVQRIWHTQESLSETYGVSLSTASEAQRPPDSEKNSPENEDYSEAGLKSQQFATPFTATQGSTISAADQKRANIAVYEVHDRNQQIVFSVAGGVEGFLTEPVRPRRLGERWYPFFMLAYNWVDGEYRPLSDVEQWIELQDEYNTTRTNYAEHRRRAIPARIGNSNAITPEDAKKISDPGINELVLVAMPVEQPVGNVVGTLSIPAVDPALYDTSYILSDLDRVSGLQDAQRGAVLRSKTATEAEISNAGLMSRMSERRDENEEFIAEMATYSLEVLLQEMTLEQVRKYAGPDAVWPAEQSENLRELYYNLNVEVRAGSAGKPDSKREQETWTAAMPVIRDAVAQISQLQASGNTAMAEAMKGIVNEMLRRFDDRISIDQFLPIPGAPGTLPPVPPVLPGASGNANANVTGPVSMTGGSAHNTSDVPPKNNPTFQ